MTYLNRLNIYILIFVCNGKATQRKSDQHGVRRYSCDQICFKITSTICYLIGCMWLTALNDARGLTITPSEEV